MSVGNDIRYIGLELSVRPPRLAVVWPSPVADWQPWALRILESISRKWGGAGDVLVPCSISGDVHSAIWRLFRFHDPDRVGYYVQTRRGLELSSPARFAEWLNETTPRMASDNPDMAPERITELLRADSVMRRPLYGWQPPGGLTQQILKYTAPHHSGDEVFADFIGDEWVPGYHFADMALLEPVDEAPLATPDASAFSDDVQLLIAMRAGAISPAYAAVLEKAGVTVDVVPISESRLSEWLQFVWQPYAVSGNSSTVLAREVTPLGRTLAGCTFFHPFVKWDERIYPIVVGSSADDFALALALDRILDGAAWLPPSLLDDEPTRTAALRGIGRTLWDLTPPTQLARQVVFTSTSETPAALSALQEDISRNSLYGTVEAEIVDVEVLNMPDMVQRVWDVEANRIARIEPFLGARQATRLETPIPSRVEQRRTSVPEAPSLPGRYFAWEVDVWIDGYQMPPRACMADSLTEAGPFDRDIRASRDGVSYFSQTGFVLAGESLRRTLSRPRLLLPSAPDIFSALLGRHQLTCEISQAGRYLQSMVDIWGGIDPLVEVVGTAPSLRILREFVAPAPRSVAAGQSDDPSTPDRVYLTGVGRNFLTFGSMAATSGLPEDELRELVDDWTARRALRRGLILKCGACMYANWYSVDEVGHSFRCPRCSAETLVTRDAWRMPTAEPHWYYQLAEVAYQAVANNAHATILALGSLKEGTRSFLWAPELLVLDASGEPVAEHDIWAVVDGRVVVGEANITGNFGSSPARRINQLLHTADAASADEVILATTAATWSAAVISRLQGAFSGTEANIRVLSGLQS